MPDVAVPPSPTSPSAPTPRLRVVELKGKRIALSRGESRTEPLWVRVVLITLALAILTVFLFLPLAVVFTKAFEGGWAAYVEALKNPASVAAIKLTLLTAAITVPLNVTFGIMAAWSIAKFEFPGKNLLTTLIDLPFSVSPVISGLVFVLLFGRTGVFAALLQPHDIKIVFAIPGIILATTFVTFPFVARELIPLMQAQGTDEEQAAMVLGATGWQTFWRVTVPNIKWGLLYGVVLCNARAMGEFGAVSVVSGHIIGQTNTMPLQIQQYYEDGITVSAFALSSLLAMLALVTLLLKNAIEWAEKS